MRDLAAFVVGLLALALAAGVAYTIIGLCGFVLIEVVMAMLLVAIFLIASWGLGHAIIEKWWRP